MSVSRTDIAERRKKLQDTIQQSFADARSVKHGEPLKYDRTMADMLGNIGLLTDLGNQEIALAHDELGRKTDLLTRATTILYCATIALVVSTVVHILVTIGVVHWGKG